MLSRLNFLTPRLPMTRQLPNSQPSTSRRVAVIGAGAGGLIAARELGREGHSVVVFERGSQVGGTWVYSPEIESDPLGVDPHRTRVHSSLYHSLRTNLSRELMGYLDYPFTARDGDDRDPRRFPGHGEVLKYLGDFATDFGIRKLVRFRTEVVFAGADEIGKWRIGFRCESGIVEDEVFDAVVVCVGHYSEPRVAEISVDDNRVGPLYKHVFPPALAPGLSFVGLPFKVAPFPMFELQSNWVAGVLSNRITLPSQDEMIADVEAFYSSLEAKGKSKHHSHEMSDCQFEYCDWLAATCGCPPYNEWRKQMYNAISNFKHAHLESYRDEWHDDELIQQAHEEFITYLSNGSNYYEIA